MSTLVNQSLDDVNITVDATGAATKHMIEVAQGKLDMSMTSPTVYNFMKAGTAMYKEMADAPTLAENLRLIYWFPLGQYHIVVYADSGIETAADIKGKRVFLGPPGGGAWAAANTWVNILTGYKPDDGLRERQGQLVLGVPGLPGSPVRRLRDLGHRAVPAARTARPDLEAADPRPVQGRVRGEQGGAGLRLYRPGRGTGDHPGGDLRQGRGEHRRCLHPRRRGRGDRRAPIWTPTSSTRSPGPTGRRPRPRWRRIPG